MKPKVKHRTVDLPLMCTNCKACKTRKRIVAEDGNTQAHYPICETCQAGHTIVWHAGALITLTPKETNVDFAQLDLFGKQEPAVA